MCSWKVCMHCLLYLSQRRVVLSSLPDTTSRPSGLKRALRTQLLCPVRVNWYFCRCTVHNCSDTQSLHNHTPTYIHTLRVLSSDEVRRDCPSLEKSTDLTEAVWALNTVDSPLLYTQYDTGKVPKEDGGGNKVCY